MRTFVFIFISAMLGIFITSCMDDNNETKARYAEMGVTRTGPDDEPLVITDSESTLQLLDYPSSFDFDESERVLLRYSVDEEGTESDLYDYLVDVYSIQDIITKDILELNEENRDTIGTDRIIINDIWISAGYLNIDFAFDGDDLVHYINVVKDPGEQPDDSTEIKLQVRHDARDDNMIQRYRGLMSFYLEPLQIEDEGELKIIFEDQSFYVEPFSVELTYEY